ncbi:MAG TPA: anthranilate phosphoribosyltransferase [Candidatus Dormibacteraeota bacterium]|jgi:anthranilate phosphoribosyltransferase|nr:anthranilate phosphoribosyltransferase [Candidatus Dormibacteraeota bacterium]
MIRDAVRRLVEGGELTREEAAEAMDEVMEGQAPPEVLAAFLVALRMKGESVAEIAGLVTSMRAHAVAISAPEGAVDTCGTGGDGSGSFNISTTAALVARGAGAVVAKHGNRAASSRCGSADVLEALGVPVGMPAEAVQACLDGAGIAFLFAPTFHPAMRHAGPVRAALGVRTVFNILGPLANPARVRRQALGVGAAALGERMALVLLALGHERALVFHGGDGFDELTLGGPSRVWEVRDGAIREYDVDPAGLGLAPAGADALRGGDAARNAEIVHEVLGGAGGPRRDVVLLNAAAALVAAGLAADLATGLELGARSIDSGAARDALARLVEVSQGLAA